MADFPHLQRLLDVMRALRDPQTGCPWDREQTMQSIIPFTIEEAYEVADAIERGDMQDIRDELGDLLFQVVFYTQLANEQDEFDFDAVAQGVADKLIRRHPHVFAEVNFDSVAAIKDNWEAVKQAERVEKGIAQDASILANITTGLPPLVRANKLQKRCAKVGFDWPDVTQVVDKIHEELDEVMAEVQASTPNQDAIEDEVGDLLFAVVNMARHLKVDPESALRRANRKFEQRFRRVEQRLADQKLSLSDANLMQMEDAWQWVKNQTE